jgi:hypothetical protein
MIARRGFIATVIGVLCGLVSWRSSKPAKCGGELQFDTTRGVHGLVSGADVMRPRLSATYGANTLDEIVWAIEAFEKDGFKNIRITQGPRDHFLWLVDAEFDYADCHCS